MFKVGQTYSSKSRLGMFALTVALLLFTFGPVHGNTVHFIRGFFIGLALTVLLVDLYQRRRLSL